MEVLFNGFCKHLIRIYFKHKLSFNTSVTTNALIVAPMLSFLCGSCHLCLKHIPCGSAGKESACNVGEVGSIPGLGRSPGEGKGFPLQYSGLENSMNCIVHGVAKSRTQLCDVHFQGSEVTCLK